METLIHFQVLVGLQMLSIVLPQLEVAITVIAMIKGGSTDLDLGTLSPGDEVSLERSV